MITLSSFPKDWQPHLKEELALPYIQSLNKFLLNCQSEKKTIYPEKKNIFRAFQLTTFNKVKVVILGQDPYHGPGQAHGLAFSVPPHTKIPPSLRNIFSELEADLQIPYPKHGCLDKWAEHGVLLLNSILTVENNNPGSHQKQGWETFTDRIIEILNSKKDNLVFMLWGNYAQSKSKAINAKKHLVLTAVHPSPLSAYRGFFGCRHFSQANQYLTNCDKNPVSWNLGD